MKSIQMNVTRKFYCMEKPHGEIFVPFGISIVVTQKQYHVPELEVMFQESSTDKIYANIKFGDINTTVSFIMDFRRMLCDLYEQYETPEFPFQDIVISTKTLLLCLSVAPAYLAVMDLILDYLRMPTEQFMAWLYEET